jgi:hypothetical protein
MIAEFSLECSAGGRTRERADYRCPSFVSDTASQSSTFQLTWSTVNITLFTDLHKGREYCMALRSHFENRERICQLLVVALANILLTLSAAGQQSRVYIDYADGQSAPTDSTPGDSWSNAYKYLRNGLARAATLASPTATIEVWVAADTYRPDEDSSNPTGDGDTGKSFSLHNNIRLYGGFLGLNYPGGGETAKNQRRPLQNLTILSGDLENDDQPDFVNYDDNSEQIITAFDVNDSAVVDGFVIRGATGSGVSIGESDCAIVNCTIINNKGLDGGGMFITSASSATIINCKFMSNFATHVGGGLTTRVGSSSSTVRIINCLFASNTAQDAGGGVRAGRDTTTWLYNCTFAGMSLTQTPTIFRRSTPAAAALPSGATAHLALCDRAILSVASFGAM